MKNELNDLKYECTIGPKSIKEYFEIEYDMVLENENLIVDFNLFKGD